MQQQASIIWKGSLKNGSGEISTGSGALQHIPYTFTSRFEGEKKGTNPEELIGAALGGCFTMALSAALSKLGFEVGKISTEALVMAEKDSTGLTLTESHLKVEADVPGISEAQLRSVADETRKTCPIARALSFDITVEARLKNNSQEIFLEQMI